MWILNIYKTMFEHLLNYHFNLRRSYLFLPSCFKINLSLCNKFTFLHYHMCTVSYLHFIFFLKILGKSHKVQFIWLCEMLSAEVMLVRPKQFCQNSDLKKNLLLTWHLMVPLHCYTGIDLKYLQFLLLL